jgi:hypothetical protein
MHMNVARIHLNPQSVRTTHKSKIKDRNHNTSIEIKSMVANSPGDLYYKVMAMAMEKIGEEMDELWWWIFFDEL